MKIPRSLNSDSAYMLGMLYGKGEIFINSNNHSCEFSFKIKYRRPTVDALRADNENVDLITVNDDTIEVAVFNEFQRFSAVFEEILGTTVNLRPFTRRNYNRDGWSMKEMIIRTYSMKTKSKILTELFGQDEITKNTIQHIPDYFFSKNISNNLILSFIQGFFDACALPPSEVSSAYSGQGRPRLQAEVNWNRWYLPIEFCQLIQQKLRIPVNMINWGHPSNRGTNSYRGQNHQFRIWIDSIIDFPYPLFRLTFKQDALERLINRTNIEPPESITYCPDNVRGTDYYVYECNNHNEDDTDIVSELRNLHFDTRPKTKQMCKLLGCPLCTNFNVHIKYKNKGVT